MPKLKIAQELLDIIYPVGSIFLTVSNDNPSKYFGGTWEKISGGFLYGCASSIDNNTSTGVDTSKAGSGNTGSTKLSVSQMPSHNHTITVNSKSLTGNLNSMYGSSGVSPLRDNCRVDGVFSRNSTTTVNTPGYTAVKGYGLHIDVSHNHGASSSNTGGNNGHTHTLNDHSHVVSHIGVWVWKRTA